MAPQMCKCCKRIYPPTMNGHEKDRCWECGGRKPTAGHVVPPLGERDAACPHTIPGTK